jgi:arylsulfatase A-like enzyme
LLPVLSLGGVGGMIGCDAAPGRPNIVLVVLDTVREDYTGVGGSEVPRTPHLDRIAGEGTLFLNAWATAPWTVPSHASFFTGLLASEHGSTHQTPSLDPSLTTIAEILTGAGYETTAFFSNTWLADRTTGLLRGFSQRVEAPQLGGAPGDPGRYRGDQGGRASNLNVQQWLRAREGDSPFFLFVNFLESHHPYDPSPAVRKAHLSDLERHDHVSSNWVMEYQAGLHPVETVDWQRIGRLYGGDVISSDQLLGDLVTTLQQMDLYDETVVIVTSDHGENLGDHGLLAHQFSVHETLLAVPLVVRYPGRLQPGVRTDPIMLTDLFATLVDVAGVEGVELPRHSISVLNEALTAQRPLIAEYSTPHPSLLAALRQINPDVDMAGLSRAFRTVRHGNLRLTQASDGSLQLHDLEVDPAQTRNLATERPEDVVSLLMLLKSSLPDKAFEGQPLDIDESTREQLRSLGYIR